MGKTFDWGTRTATIQLCYCLTEMFTTYVCVQATVHIPAFPDWHWRSSVHLSPHLSCAKMFLPPLCTYHETKQVSCYR